MRQIFGQTITRLAEKDKNIVLLTGDVEQEMQEFREKFPERFFNLGMCEQSITGLAAGLATDGMRPVVYSITPFVLERPFEQVKIDIDEQNLPVILVGFSDYPTHGPTHRALNPSRMATVFKNIQTYFPSTTDLAEKAIIDAYLTRIPSMIHLQKMAAPFL
jgi:transketolase